MPSTPTSKMPAPFAYAHQESLAWLASRRNHRRAMLETVLSVHPREDTRQPIYTAAELQACRDAALEEAAAEALEHDETNTSGYDTAHQIAAAIRKLKGPQP